MLGWHREAFPSWINPVGSGGKEHLVVSLRVRQMFLQGMNLVVKSHWTAVAWGSGGSQVTSLPGVLPGSLSLEQPDLDEVFPYLSLCGLHQC